MKNSPAFHAVAIKYIAAKLALCHERHHCEAVVENAKKDHRDALDILSGGGFDGRVLIDASIGVVPSDFAQLLLPGAPDTVDLIGRQGHESITVSLSAILSRHADLCFS